MNSSFTKPMPSWLPSYHQNLLDVKNSFQFFHNQLSENIFRYVVE